MRVKVLKEAAFQIVGVVQNGTCPAEDFIAFGEESTRASREGLFLMLERVAELGPRALTAAWTHEASKTHKINEFIKGDLRLFYFKGAGRQLVVCTTGVRKKGRRADASAVKAAAAARQQYLLAIDSNSIEVIPL